MSRTISFTDKELHFLYWAVKEYVNEFLSISERERKKEYQGVHRKLKEFK